MALANKGDLRAAEIALKKAIGLAPARGDLRLAVARLHLQMDRYAEAEEDVRLAQQRGIAAAIALPEMARIWLEQGSPARVLQDYVPNDSMSATDLAQCLSLRALAQVMLKLNPEAQHSLDEATLLGGGGLPEVAVAEAQLQLNANQPAKAEALLDDLLARQPKEYQALMLKAMIRLQAQDLAGALALYDQAVLLRPAAGLPRIARTATLLGLGRVEEAERDAELLRQYLPKNPLVMLLQAQLLARSGKSAEAWAALRPGITDLSHNISAQLLAGSLNLQLGNMAQARDFAAVAAGLAPDSPPVTRLLAAVELRGGDPAKAAELLEKFLKSQPDDAATLADLAAIYDVIGRSEKASATLDQAAKLAPDNPNIQFSRAVADIRAGDLGAAIAPLEVALAQSDPRAGATLAAVFLAQGRIDDARGQAQIYARRNPGSPQADALLGEIELAAGNLTLAQQHFESSLAKDGEFVPALRGLATCYQRLGQPAKGLDVYREAVLKDKQNETAQLSLIAAASRGGDDRQALQLADAALDVLPNSIALATARIELLLRAKRPNDALEAAQRLFGTYPQRPEIMGLLAKVEAFAGQTSNAVATLRLMASKSPGAGDLQLAEYLIKLGRRDEARSALDAAVGKTPGMIELWQLRVEDEKQRHGVRAALDLARTARKVSPQMADILTGDLLVRDGKFEEAIEPYHAAFDAASPTSARPMLVRLVGCMIRAKHTAEAKQMLLAWLGKHPADIGTRLTLADQQFSEKDYDAARQSYEKLLVEEPNNVEALNNLALIYQSQHSDEKALAAARKAHQVAPNSPAVADTLGWMLLQQGATTDALPLLQQAQSAGKGADPTISYHLAAALAKAGKRDQAVTLLASLTRAPPFPEQDQAQSLARKLGENP